jgi:hypothetical protein
MSLAAAFLLLLLLLLLLQFGIRCQLLLGILSLACPYASLSVVTCVTLATTDSSSASVTRYLLLVS